MKYWKNKIITAASLWLFMMVAGVNAQQNFNPGWSSYVGGDWDWDGVYAVAVDSQTNSYIGGILGQGTIHNNADIYSLTDYQGARDGFVAKLSGSGALDWYLCLGDENNDCIMGLAIHTNGTVYAAGVSDRYLIDDYGSDALLSSIAGSSGSFNWTVRLGNANGTNGFNAVAVDSGGYVYAVGYTTFAGLSNSVPGYQVGGTTYGKQLKGNTDAFVVKFSPGGSIVWTHYLGGTNADTATAIAVASDGSVYVGGQTRSPGWASLPSGTPGPNNPDAFLVKLTSTGTHVWSAFLGGSSSDAVTALAKDPTSSALFLGGSTASSDFLSGATNLNFRGGGTDGFVVKLTDTGATFQTNWCRFFGGSATDLVTSLTLQPNGAVMAGGTTASGSWLTQTASTFGGVQDGFLSLLSSGGAVVWSSYVGGARSEELRAVASVSTTVLAVGTTFSPYWVSGGFYDTWTKDPNLNDPPIPDYNADLSYGFVAKWSSEPGVPPTVTGEPSDVTVHEGGSATFSVTATGFAPLAYKWFRNGAPVTGFTSTNTYVLAAAARTNNSDTYACLVSNYFGTATSRSAKLTVISNGTLTVTLSPAAAVAQGARWSMNSGATWFASGSGTNVWPGAYTVTFASITGWTAPATRSNVQVAAGAIVSITGIYTAVLPSAARSITGTNVTVVVRAPAGLSTWVLVETLSVGLTPTSYTAGGSWDSSAHTLTFTGTEATTNTLSYKVSCSTSGVYTVSGTVTPQPANVPVTVTGDNRIIKSNLIRIISGASVTLSVYQPSSTRRWWVDETLPAGLTPGNMVGPEPTWDPDAHVLDFYKNRGVGETLTYTVTGAPGTYILSGSGNVTGSDESVLGDTVLIIPSAVIPPPDILSFTPVAGMNACNLTFTSVVSQAYVILTNATLHATNAWATYLPVTGDSGVTQRQVPMNGPRLFYRVRVQP